jgi:hypothetical protein
MKALLKVLLLASFAVAGQSFANDDSIEFDQPIQIDGQYSRPRVKASDRLKKLRAKLEKQNEIMVQKKIEEVRLQSELELMKKLQKVFNQNMKMLEQL